MKYVALLRGIGPTNPNMRSEKLREFFESLGYKNVQSVIATGNILFETTTQHIQQLEEKIETALPKKLGFSSTTIIRSQSDLKKIMDNNLFGNIEDTPNSRLNITFLKKDPETDLEFPYYGKNKSYTVLGISDKAVFTTIDLSGTKTPDVMLWLEKQFGKEITTRTWKTVMKIMNKWETSEKAAQK